MYKKARDLSRVFLHRVENKCLSYLEYWLLRLLCELGVGLSLVVTDCLLRLSKVLAILFQNFMTYSCGLVCLFFRLLYRMNEKVIINLVSGEKIFSCLGEITSLTFGLCAQNVFEVKYSSSSSSG